MSGTICGIFIKEAVGGAMRPVTAAQALANKGLEGDANIGKRRRQVLLIEQETIAEWGLAPGAVRENVTVRNLVLAGLREGTRLQVGSAVFEVTGDCAPCEFMDGLAAGLRAKSAGRRGTLCRVVTGGTLAIGELVALAPASVSG
jgi:MOSC domain-containing protein YiiM